MDKLKFAFFGSSRYSVAYLEALAAMENLEPSLVVSQPDKPAGRGLRPQPTPVKTWAKQHGILVLTPDALADPLFQGTLSSLPLEFGVSAYYGLLIPGVVIDHFKKGVLNVHHSLLPKHRGGSPIPWTILAGEKVAGTTIIKIGVKFDDGEILAQEEVGIVQTDTTESLRERLDKVAVKLLTENLPKYLAGEITLRKQTPSEGGYDPRITKEAAKIDWEQSDEQIERAVRAFYPWPGAWTNLRSLIPPDKIKNERNGAKRVLVQKAHLDENRKLVIDTVQIEGKTPISWKQLMSGYAAK